LQNKNKNSIKVMLIDTFFSPEAHKSLSADKYSEQQLDNRT